MEYRIKVLFFRLAGNITGNRSIGWALHNAYHTLNRVSPFCNTLALFWIGNITPNGVICFSAIAGVAGYSYALGCKK